MQSVHAVQSTSDEFLAKIERSWCFEMIRAHLITIDMASNCASSHQSHQMLVAVSLMVFYVFAAQCMATFAVVKTETNTWKWPLFMIAYMTFLAYIMSLLVYQVGKYLFLI